MTYDYHVPGGTTPDNSSDFPDETTVTTILDGRTAYDKYSDGDSDDSDADYRQVHNRRNSRSLPNSVPDPYYKRGNSY